MTKTKKKSRLKNCIVHTVEGWQCYARQSMSMAVRTWILAITCMSAVVIHPVIPTSGT